MLDTGYWVLDTGYWVLGTGYWIPDTGYWILDSGFWLLAKLGRIDLSESVGPDSVCERNKMEIVKLLNC